MKRFLFLALAAAGALVVSACGSTSSCDSTNCTGCCSSSGACMTGDTASSCGTGGAACSVCSNGQSCNANHVCAGVDPESTWKVQPASATIKNNNNGAQWDPDNSAPDAKVELYCPQNATDKTSETDTVDDSYSPTWSSGGCVLKASELLSGGFAYQVIDADVLGGDPITQKVNVTVTEDDLLAGVSQAVPSDGLTALRISLQKQ